MHSPALSGAVVAELFAAGAIAVVASPMLAPKITMFIGDIRSGMGRAGGDRVGNWGASGAKGALSERRCAFVPGPGRRVSRSASAAAAVAKGRSMACV